MNPDELSSARNALLEVAERLRQRVAGKWSAIFTYYYILKLHIRYYILKLQIHTIFWLELTPSMVTAHALTNTFEGSKS